MTSSYSIWITAAIFFLSIHFSLADNLTCYQCTKKVNEECNEKDLKQCPPEKDRCVTHITKDEKNGFAIKRECGLGPCGFDDAMMNRGLGLDGCDRSKHEYFCLFCCRQNGCNKSSANKFIPSIITSLLLTSLSIFFIRYLVQN